MDGVSNVSGARHFSREEEEALRQDASTTSIVKRDAGGKVDIHGNDETWRTTKSRQQAHVGLAGKLEIELALAEGSEFAGVAHAASHAVAAAEVATLAEVVTSIGGPLAALGLGLSALHEAKANGEEQARALARDDAHVALIGTLDLPTGYKTARLDGDYKHVAKGARSPATKIAETLHADAKGRAVLQLHADRGILAARDMVGAGVTREAFFAAHPKIADAYKKDAAFHEGFDAYVFARQRLPGEELNAMETKLQQRNGWYAQSQVQVRA